LESGAEIRSLTGHTGSVNAVTLTTDSRRVISASDDQTLKIWDLESGVELRTLVAHTSWVNAVAVTADGRRAISASDDHTLVVWDLKTGAEKAKFFGDGSFLSCAASPGTDTFIAGDSLGRVHFLRLEEPAPIAA
jgi:WD40 repeat protein